MTANTAADTADIRKEKMHKWQIKTIVRKKEKYLIPEAIRERRCREK
jgi:hypothetical protein